MAHEGGSSVLYLPYAAPNWKKISPILRYVTEQKRLTWDMVFTCLQDLISLTSGIQADLSALVQFSRLHKDSRVLELCQLSASWALNSPMEFRGETSIPMLRARSNGRVQLTSDQTKSLLSMMFWCVFPSTRGGTTNMNHNFARVFSLTKPQQVAKIECVFSYFDQVTVPSQGPSLTFQRISDRYMQKIANLRPVEIVRNPSHSSYTLIVDFANAYLGGGVLGNGCAQEEIMLLSYFEPIVGLLFVEKLEDNEVLYISGIRQFSICKGYGDSFGWERKGMGRDDGNVIVAMDAIDFKNKEGAQYSREAIDRELVKASIAFKLHAGQQPLPILTGNWGCGAFRGNPQLKFLIQWVAASTSPRAMRFLPFDKPELRDLESFITQVSGCSAEALLRCLYAYEREGRGMDMFQFCVRTIQRSKAAASRNNPAQGFTPAQIYGPNASFSPQPRLSQSYAGSSTQQPSSFPVQRNPKPNPAALQPAGMSSLKRTSALPLRSGSSAPPVKHSRYY